MDTSETYIKMCEKAEEIQKSQMLGWCSGDFMYDGKRIVVWHRECGLLEEEELGELRVWLPRQDQLQEMIGDFQQCVDKMVFWCEEGKARITFDKMSYTFTSMEQLWLALVMFERYGKMWSGENWVKEE